MTSLTANLKKLLNAGGISIEGIMRDPDYPSPNLQGLVVAFATEAGRDAVMIYLCKAVENASAQSLRCQPATQDHCQVFSDQLPPAPWLFVRVAGVSEPVDLEGALSSNERLFAVGPHARGVVPCLSAQPQELMARQAYRRGMDLRLETHRTNGASQAIGLLAALFRTINLLKSQAPDADTLAILDWFTSRERFTLDHAGAAADALGLTLDELISMRHIE